MEIIWRGNEHTNKIQKRRGCFPIAVVNHITAVSAKSVDNWFRSHRNSVSSAHFLVTKKGEIKQYINLEDGAWANGLTSGKRACTSELVSQRNYQNPNLYTVSIEHESNGESLTEEQYKASLWLHKYIQSYIKKKWDYYMPFDRKHIIGHYEIDNIRKPCCPGKNFPFDRLIKDLNIKEENMIFSDESETSKWALSAVKEMIEIGIMHGDNDGKFNPQAPVTRQEIAVIIDRTLKYIQGQTTEHSEEKDKSIEYLEVVANALNVRDDIYGNKLGVVYKGDKLEKVSERKGWYYIRFGELTGYVHGNYVKNAVE